MVAKMKSLVQKMPSQKVLQNAPRQTKLLKRKVKLLLAASNSNTTLVCIVQENKISPIGYRLDAEFLHNLSDVELIEVIKNQNQEAYCKLFARYQKKLFFYIYHLVGSREETEDILQNVFAKTYRNIGYFDMTRKFSSWIYRIAHNESVNYLKRKSKRYTVSWEDILTSKDKLDSAFNDEHPAERMAHQEVADQIAWALEKIPEKYQQVLKMRYFDEYSYEEMAKILHKPVNTVGTLINRAKRKLLGVMKGKNGKNKPSLGG